MLNVASIRSATDQELLESLREVVARTNRGAASLIAHLAEVDSRRLYLDAACSSMFAYCTQRLGFDEGAAFKRIAVARLVRRIPMVLEMIAAGRVHLAGLSVLGPHLTEENHRTLLRAACGKSRRDIELMVAELAPRPDAPTIVRRLAGPKPALAPAPTAVLPAAPPVSVSPTQPPLADPARASLPEAPPEEGASRDDRATPPIPRPVSSETRPAATGAVSPLGGHRYRIQVTASEETVGKLRRAQALLGDQVQPGDVAAVLDRALEVLCEQLTRRRFGTSRRRAVERRRPAPVPVSPEMDVVVAETPAPEPTVPGDSSAAGPVPQPARLSRRIPAEVRRRVWERDGGRCAFVDDSGRRCAERRHLELDHVVPFARGGANGEENVRLLCRAHNQHLARRVFGAARIERRIAETAGRRVTAGG